MLVHRALDQGHPSHLSSANGANQWPEGGKRGAPCPQPADPYRVFRVTEFSSPRWMLPFADRFRLLPSEGRKYVFSPCDPFSNALVLLILAVSLNPLFCKAMEGREPLWPSLSPLPPPPPPLRTTRTPKGLFALLGLPGCSLFSWLLGTCHCPALTPKRLATE